MAVRNRNGWSDDVLIRFAALFGAGGQVFTLPWEVDEYDRERIATNYKFII